MKQYTTEWAKKYLRENPWAHSIAQHKNLKIIACECSLIIVFKKWWQPDLFGHWNQDTLSPMLEHPDGWKKSLVTRDNL